MCTGVCVYAYLPCVCLRSEVRRGHQIPGAGVTEGCDYRAGAGTESGFCVEVTRVPKYRAISPVHPHLFWIFRMKDLFFITPHLLNGNRVNKSYRDFLVDETLTSISMPRLLWNAKQTEWFKQQNLIFSQFWNLEVQDLGVGWCVRWRFSQCIANGYKTWALCGFSNNWIRVVPIQPHFTLIASLEA